MTTREDRIAAYQQRLVDTMLEHGVAIQGVFPSAADPEDSVPFAYTIGLTAHDHPEVLVFGLPADVVHAVLNSLASHVMEGGTIELNTRVPDIFGNEYPAMLLPVSRETAHEYVCQAVGLLGDDVDAIQLVWPDADGRFPWEPGYAVPQTAQPIVGTPPQT